MTKIKQLARPIAKEFHRDSCGFNHTPADDFVKSQWQSRSKSVIYLIYRWIIGLFFVGVVIESILFGGSGYHFFIFLTNWGILMCMFTNLLGAVLVSIYHFHPEYEDRLLNMETLTCPFRIYWGMHITTLVVSIAITIVYWTLLYGPEVPLTASNILTHACNSGFMFLDLLIVAYPIRLLHIFLPFTFGSIFAVFSYVYYVAGGLDHHGNPFIYTVLDWRNTQGALITCIGVLLLTCFIYIVVFMVYKVRVFIYRRIYSPAVFNPTTDTTTIDGNSKTIDTKGIQHSPSGISMVLGNYTGYENQGFSTISEKVEKRHSLDVV
ncbi:protein rolling stone [Eupeodes corollae]|uniref:protein rolling stone n=1 Tax=Eupeodes corollae TaxID=290404 RepID=UPI00249387E0|nr:protein rolling stone [Eupeodes corollae]